MLPKTEVPEVTMCLLKSLSGFHSENDKWMGRNRKRLNPMNIKASCGSRNRIAAFCQMPGTDAGP